MRRRLARKAAWGFVALALAVGSAVATSDSRVGIAILRAAPQDQSPCACTWVGHETDMEEYLRTAKVARMEDVPLGVTKPKRGFFEPGGPIASFAWKQLPPGLKQGYWESYKAEIAAYELDKLLDLHMVPPTVERRIDSERGAAQQWVEHVKGWDMKKPAQGPEPGWSKQVSRMKLFDQLTANIDRNQGNLIYDGDWHLILIDHSRAFTDRKDLKGVAQPGRVDKQLWDKMETLTLDQLQGALGPWLGKKETNAILARRDKMREAIRRMVAQRGEASVFLQ